MKVYTKQGDKGQTSVIGGKRSKANARVEAYGSIDELLANIGEVVNYKNLPKRTKDELILIVDKLFDLNRSLASIDINDFINEDDVIFLENSIDYMDSKLEPLSGFILPLGSSIYTKLNTIRTVVRRAERNTIRLSLEEEINPTLIKYLNRLSDYFFMASRYANYCNNDNEIMKIFK